MFAGKISPLFGGFFASCATRSTISAPEIAVAYPCGSAAGHSSGS
jgi:hypothetical protein